MVSGASPAAIARQPPSQMDDPQRVRSYAGELGVWLGEPRGNRDRPRPRKRRAVSRPNPLVYPQVLAHSGVTDTWWFF